MDALLARWVIETTGRRRKNFDPERATVFSHGQRSHRFARSLIESVSLKENRPAIPDRVKERRGEASLELFRAGVARVARLRRGSRRF